MTITVHRKLGQRPNHYHWTANNHIGTYRYTIVIVGWKLELPVSAVPISASVEPVHGLKGAWLWEQTSFKCEAYQSRVFQNCDQGDEMEHNSPGYIYTTETCI